MALSRPEGVLIRGIQRGGPADRAGMQVRDVVLEIEGKSTRNVPQLLARIAELPPGSSAKIRVMREGQDLEVDVTVGQASEAGVAVAGSVPSAGEGGTQAPLRRKPRGRGIEW